MRKRIWLWSAVLAAGAVLIWISRGGIRIHQSAGGPAAVAGKSGKGRGGASGPIPVGAQKARLGEIPIYFDGLGSVTAYYTVTVRSRVDGQLMNVTVHEGAFVQQGQLLAEIDPRPFQAQLEQAEGQMARDVATLENARLDLLRYETLVKQDAIPHQQLDTQRATVHQLEAAIKQDQASIDTARLQLVYAHITAPISGRIGLRLVDPGNIIHSSDTTGLLLITQLQPITVLFTLPEDNLPPVLKKLRAGATLAVEAFNRDMSVHLASGYLKTPDNQIDPQTGTLRLKAVFANRQGVLYPNQFVNVRLLVERRRNAVIIPPVAIQRGQQGTFIYVVRSDGTVELRTVAIGVTESNSAEVTSGLRPGETVVTDSIDRLQPGAKVRIREQAGTAAVAGAEGPVQ
ncbi:MAG: MdtA/MuxA family multidrug efflux RND transporter periplasmic adaptor subunit [Bryobacterales bacterium]|nr:MdtA/MuxA family multidrug efflux RND transporter periplasmic adaptor subunit [Bryobacterales bacterium]